MLSWLRCGNRRGYRLASSREQLRGAAHIWPGIGCMITTGTFTVRPQSSARHDRDLAHQAFCRNAKISKRFMFMELLLGIGYAAVFSYPLATMGLVRGRSVSLSFFDGCMDAEVAVV